MSRMDGAGWRIQDSCRAHLVHFIFPIHWQKGEPAPGVKFLLAAVLSELSVKMMRDLPQPLTWEALRQFQAKHGIEIH